MQQETSTLVTVKQAAALLSVSPYALYRKLQNGKLPCFKFGRKVLIDIAEIKTAMRSEATGEVGTRSASGNDPQQRIQRT